MIIGRNANGGVFARWLTGGKGGRGCRTGEGCRIGGRRFVVGAHQGELVVFP